MRAAVRRVESRAALPGAEPVSSRAGPVARPRLGSRAGLLVIATAALLLAAPAGAWAHEGEDEPLPADTGDDLTPVYEIPAGADRIIGSPEAGPKPQHSGDRGGSLQFVTLGAVAVAVAFIMWRVARSARRASHRVPADSRG